VSVSVVAPAVGVKIVPSDRAVALTVPRGNAVTVLGPSGASLLRIDGRNLDSELDRQRLRRIRHAGSQPTTDEEASAA
jgi:ABC-type transporter Mla maintaining outer membrane lipid asymmetry ATPase subunit MlaF